MLKMFWTCSGFHPIFTYILIKVQMFFTLLKPYVMFPFNSLVLLPQLSLLRQCQLWCLLPLRWRCQLWYYYNLCNDLYHYWYYPYHCWALQMVPFYPLSFFMPSNMCSPIPSSFLSMRLLHFQL
jgi:hypothetical protein